MKQLNKGVAKLKATAATNEKPVKEKRVGQVKNLTDRDREILRFVGQNGVAALGQLHGRYWTNAKERTAQERLQMLVNGGYLERGSTDTRRPGEIIYGLTRKGAKEFGKLEARRLTIGLPSRGEMKQQLIMQDAYTRLEKDLAARGAKLLDWKNERELRGEQRREQIRTKGRAAGVRSRLNFADITDGQAVIQEADGSITELDIEADGQYYGKMLKDKLSNLGRSNSRPIVWVTVGSRRAGRIEHEIEEAGISNIEVWQLV